MELHNILSEPIPTPDKLYSTNYPNPFNPTTTISFNLSAENCEVAELSIYNVKGQKVRTFTNQQITNSTNQQILWDGTDNNNNPISSGVYLYKLNVNGQTKSVKKCLLIK
ncbi:MAG: T9SS type A sorting domain-containing protein [Candidatus Cloacimonetes bacterium]|nr:T9SS type A sorting domain-containing protein [Candidatus Cloacimonadota bacterium]